MALQGKYLPEGDGPEGRTSIQFLVLVTSFVTSGKAPHFSENEMLDLVRVSEYTAHDSILAVRAT